MSGMDRPLAGKLSSSLSRALDSTGGATPGFTPADLVGDSTFARYFTVRDSVTGNDGDAISGTIPDLSGNGNDFTADTLTLKEDANGYKYLDVATTSSSIDYNFTSVPEDFTYVVVYNNDGDTLGYSMSSKGENKGIGLLQANDFPSSVGFTGTLAEMSFNNKVYATQTRRTFFDTITLTGTCVSLQEFSGASSNTASTTWNIGESTLALTAHVYAVFIIDRALTAQEKIDLISYMGLTYGRALTGSPLLTDVMHFKGQSNCLGTANDGTISSPTVNNRSINYKVDTNELSYPLADPINNNTLGQSMVPAFANEWVARTGRVVCSVMSASGGSSLLPYAWSDWGTSGAILAASKTNINEAIDELAIHADYQVNAIYDVWQQGETEVINWDGAIINASNYQTALDDLADDAKTWYDANHPGLFQGTYAITLSPRYEDSTEVAMQYVDFTSNTNDINLAYLDAASGTANLNIAFRGTGAYQGLGEANGWAYDNVHWGTRAVQEIGKLAAASISGNLSDPSTPSSPYLGSDLFMDDSQSTKTTHRECDNS